MVEVSQGISGSIIEIPKRRWGVVSFLNFFLLDFEIETKWVDTPRLGWGNLSQDTPSLSPGFHGWNGYASNAAPHHLTARHGADSKYGITNYQEPFTSAARGVRRRGLEHLSQPFRQSLPLLWTRHDTLRFPQFLWRLRWGASNLCLCDYNWTSWSQGSKAEWGWPQWKRKFCHQGKRTFSFCLFFLIDF